MVFGVLFAKMKDRQRANILIWLKSHSCQGLSVCFGEIIFRNQFFELIPSTVLWDCHGPFAMDDGKKPVQHCLFGPPTQELFSKGNRRLCQAREALVEVDQKDDERAIYEDKVMGSFSGQVQFHRNH